MTTPQHLARRFYDYLASADGQALFELLTDDFVGTVSDGMPHGVGGEHRGRTAMLSDVWGRIFSIYDVHVDPAEFLTVDDTRVVVVGRYRGPARDGTVSVDAAFAHIITTRDDHISALTQITDTTRWTIPAV